MNGKIRVLVVDDSLTARKRIVGAISEDPACEVIGEAADGRTALALCVKQRPDVMTLDMMLPGATGAEVTEYVMAHCPTPILIVSASFNRGDTLKTLDALAAGAVDVLEKPQGDEDGDEWERRLLEAVKLASRIKVITHIRGKKRSSSFKAATESPAPLPDARKPVREYDVIAMGASTGGPGAVVSILGGRAFPLSVSVLLTMHIGRTLGFSFVEWLSGVLSVPVSEATDRELLPPPGKGRVIVAPADRHLVMDRGRLRLSDAPERNSCCPSIDVLFESVAEVNGPRSIGCLLTGMGRDGADGLRAMRRKGATTIAQDESSSVVFGMPREAILLGGAEHVLKLSEIGPFLHTLAGETNT